MLSRRRAFTKSPSPNSGEKRGFHTPARICGANPLPRGIFLPRDVYKRQGVASKFLTTGDAVSVSSKATQFLRKQVVFEAA